MNGNEHSLYKQKLHTILKTCFLIWQPHTYKNTGYQYNKYINMQDIANAMQQINIVKTFIHVRDTAFAKIIAL